MSHQIPHATLLTIPAEIRRQILAYLLYSPNPISRITDMLNRPRNKVPEIRRHLLHPLDTKLLRFVTGGQLGLHPHILSTCQQLYEEGRAILYDNTLQITFAFHKQQCPVDVLEPWCFSNLPTQSGERSREEARPLLKLENFSNFRFQMYVDFMAVHPWYSAVVNEVVAVLKSVVSQPLGKVVIHADECSFEERLRGDGVGDSSSWCWLLEAVMHLDCRSLCIIGTMPEMVRCDVWWDMRCWEVKKLSLEERDRLMEKELGDEG